MSAIFWQVVGKALQKKMLLPNIVGRTLSRKMLAREDSIVTVLSHVEPPMGGFCVATD
jgi:hypothetical protein